MKTLLVLLVSFTSALFTASSVQADQLSDKCVMSILLDTSPTGRWNQIRRAAENLYRSCEIGDTVLFFSVRGRHTHLKFSCIKRCTDVELDSFYSALRTSTADWFINADLARALDGPIYEKLLQHAGKEGRAIIFILSEGDLSSRQAAAICKFADKVKAAHSWPLLLASSLEKTNRQLLIAAGKGRLQWCKLADAADRAFLEKLTHKIRSSIPIAAEKITATQPIVTKVRKVMASDKDVLAKPQSGEGLPPRVQQPRASAGPNGAIAKLPARPVKKPRALKEASEKKTPEPNKPSLPVSKAKESEPVDRGDAEPSKKVKPTVSIVARPPKLTQSVRQELADTDESRLVSTSPNEAVSRNKHKQRISAPSAVVQRAKPPAKVNLKAPHTSRSAPFSSLTTRLLAIGGVSVVTIIVFLLIYGWAAAASWQRKVQNPVETARREEEKQPRLLMARVGGSSYCLGSPQHFSSAHLGSSAENTIRVNSESIEPRHLRIYRRRSNFFIRNLAKTPVIANGQEIGRKKRYRLTFPVAVSLGEGVTVHLFLAKSAGKKQSKREESKNGK